jgi:hypothetical protein
MIHELNESDCSDGSDGSDCFDGFDCSDLDRPRNRFQKKSWHFLGPVFPDRCHLTHKSRICGLDYAQQGQRLSLDEAIDSG